MAFARHKTFTSLWFDCLLSSSLILGDFSHMLRVGWRTSSRVRQLRFSRQEILPTHFRENINNYIKLKNCAAIPKNKTKIVLSFSPTAIEHFHFELHQTYTRVSMGWWLLRITVKILANLRITVNTFPLFLPEVLFTVKICQFLRLTANFLAVLRLKVNSTETF